MQIDVKMNANQAAFVTSTTLATATMGLTYLAVVEIAKKTNTVAAVVLTASAFISGAGSVASVTAWLDVKSIDARTYFSNFKNHAAVVMAGTFQVISQTLLQALLQGISSGIAVTARRWVTGDDADIRVRTL